MTKARHTEAADALVHLLELSETLREQCPWDREQTLGTIVPHTLEEAYEVADAVTRYEQGGVADSMQQIEDELGDLLFQVVFLTMLCRELDGNVHFASAARRIHDKLVRRHPHVFGDEVATTADEVRGTWEKVKREQEGSDSGDAASGIFRQIPTSLPSTNYARKAQQRAAAVGFDFASAADAMSKLREEVDELAGALSHVDSAVGGEADPPDAQVVHEVGDVLFAAVNVARLARVDAELALRASTERFVVRVAGAAQLAAGEGGDFTQMQLQEQEALYQRAKHAAD